MSLFNPTANTSARRVLLGGAALVAGALMLSGCQVRPLYGVTATTFSFNAADVEGRITNDLAAIDVEVSQIGDSDGLERIDQVLRNELVYQLTRGGEAQSSRYKLEILLDKQKDEVGLERLADVPSAYNVTIAGSFVLSDLATERTLYQGRSFATASYDFSNQRFANVRAERDAEDRATKAVATDLYARLAGYFAAR